MKKTTILLAVFLAAVLLLPLPSAGLDLVDSAGFTYDVDTGYGTVVDGSGNGLSDAFNNGYYLLVNGAYYWNSSGSYTLEDGGREVVLPEVSMSGLMVSRKIYVPVGSNFIRYLNILYNPTGSPIVVDVAVRGNLGSGCSTTIDDTTSGDTTMDIADRWMVTNGDVTDPRIAHNWDGPGGSDFIDIADSVGGCDVNFGWTWSSVTVPPGATVIYMTYGVMQVDVSTATARAQQLYAGADAMMTSGMSGAEIAQLQNWAYADSDGDGMSDGWELAYGLDPGLDDSAGDLDGDGLSNLDEYTNGADPTSGDTDSDGLGDYDEVNTHGTSPANTDTDADSLPDYYEVNAAGQDPLDSTDGVYRRITSDASNYSDQPDVAVDSSGNVHIAWADDRAGSFEVYYKMLDSSGTVLIDDTMVSDDDGNDSVRPVIGVDSTGRVFVVWQDTRAILGCWTEVYLMRLEPGLDDRNGNAADPLVIKTLGDTIVSTDDCDYSYTPRLAIDSSDNLHIVWEEEWYDIFYRKLDGNGNELVAETPLNSPYGSMWRAVPDLAVDSGGKVHIAWSDYTDGNWDYEVLYALLDGSDGSVLIAPTLMTDDDGNSSMRTSLSLDSSGRAYIVWHDKRGITNETYFMQIDPSLDDQDGSAADPAVIKTVDDTALTADDGTKSYHPFARMSPDGVLYVTYNEDSYDDVRLLIVDQTGTVLYSTQVSSSAYTGTAWTNAHIAFGSAHIVYTLDTGSGSDIMMFNVPLPEAQIEDSTLPIDDLTIDFGSVVVGGAADETVTVTNNGPLPLSIPNIAQTDILAAPFSIVGDTCSGQTLQPFGQCTVTVRFTPSTAAPLLTSKGALYAGTGFLLFGVVLMGGARNRRKLAGLLIVMAMLAGTLLASCGSGSSTSLGTAGSGYSDSLDIQTSDPNSSSVTVYVTGDTP